MPRFLRGLLRGSIAIAFLYLVVHAREPMRLNIGDPWSDANVLTSIHDIESDGWLATSFNDVLDGRAVTDDAYRYIDYSPLSRIFYGAVGTYLGVTDIGTFRLFALAFSGLAMWLLFSYVREVYSDRIALITTALFATNLLWMMYADSIHQAPVMQCTGFLALWGLARAIETKQRRHHAAMMFGSFACLFTSYDYYIFLPAAVLATSYLKAGNPFARGNRHLVALCALGCMLGILAKSVWVIGAVGWHEFSSLHLEVLERARFTNAIPTMIRRITLVFAPLIWLTAAFHVVKALRAPSLASALKGTAVWMLLAALASLYVFAPRAASQLLASQVILPFHAIGSALILDRLLDGRPLFRRFAVVWLVAALLWSFYFLFSHPRALVEGDVVARTNAYLAGNDHNDFVLSNLLSDGHIRASFQRHSWAASADADTSVAPREMMRLFELTGADHVHEVIFTDPDSRFIDKALWPLALPRRSWTISGWPHLQRSKTNDVIAEYDGRVLNNLAAVQADKVLQLKNYAVYRVDRATVMAILGETVPAASHIDFSSVLSGRHELLGWYAPNLFNDGTAASSLAGISRCSVRPCKTILTEAGLKLESENTVQAGQVMIRMAPVCDVRLTFTFATPSCARFSINGFETSVMFGKTATSTVPIKYLAKGVNVVELENMMPRILGVSLDVFSLDAEPACPAP